MTPQILDPEPRYLYGGARRHVRRHIARPDHPLGLVPTNIAFCGAIAVANRAEGTGNRDLPVCKRCSLAWVAYVDRLARERDTVLEDAAFAAVDDLEEEGENG